MELQKATYLVLEDNKTDQLILSHMMARIEIASENIHFSSSLKGILDLHYDFILSDLNIIDSSHLDTVKSIHSRFPQAVLIVLTVLGDLDMATEAIQMGAQDYLLKGEFNVNFLKKTLLFAWERHDLNRQVIQNEARFRGLIENNHDAVVIMDEETVISYASSSIKSVLGYQPEELIGKKAIDFLYPEDKSKRAELFEKLLEHKENVVSLKERIANKNGDFVWIEAKISDHRNVRGICGIVSNIKNIDQEEQALEQLKQSEKRLIDITNSIPGVVMQYQLNPDGTDKLLYLSEGTDVSWAIPREEVIEDFSKVFEMMHEEDIISCRTSILESAMELSLWNQRFRILFKDGSIRWFNSIGTPSRQPDESVIWDTIMFDITEQVKMEQALKESHERFELVGKATNDAIWDWNLKTDELYCGLGFETLFGHKTANNVMNIDFLLNNIHPSDIHRVIKDINTVKYSLDSHWEDEFRFIKSNGEISFVLCQAFIVFDENQVPVRMVGALQDLTEKRRLVNDLTERNKELSVLFSVSQLVHCPSKSVSEVLKELVDVLPLAWKYPLVTSSRIKLNGRVYKSRMFQESPFTQKSEILIDGKAIGLVEIFYSVPKPLEAEGPFLKEERGLLDIIAELLGGMIEKREAEEKLLKERLLLRTVIDNIPDSIYVKDTNLRYIVNNKANAKFLGIKSGEEALGKLSFNFLGKEADLLEKADRRVVDTGKISIIPDHVLASKGGSMVRFHTMKIPLKDNLGNTIGIVGISRDITKSKEAENRLIESEANLRTIFNNTEVGYVLINRRYEILSFNQKAYEFSAKYGEPSYCIGETILNNIPEERKLFFQSKLKKVFDNTVVTYEKAFQHDEQTEWTRITIMPVTVTPNTVVGACISISDLTVIRQAELLLKKAAANMQALLNSTDDAYTLIDKRFRIKSFNKQAEENARSFKSKKLRVGESILNYTPEPKEAMELAVLKALTGEKVDFMQSFFMDGREESMQVKVVPIVSAHEEIDEVSIVYKNITDRKTYEKELLFQQQLLLNSQQLADLGSFEWHLNTNIFHATEEFLRLFDIQTSRNIRNDFLSKIRIGDKYFVNMAFDGAIKEKKPFNLEFKTVPIHDKEKIIKGKGIVSADRTGQVTKIFCALQDITEQKTADEAMLMGQELERDRLAKDLHDDIGQLLTATKFRLEAIKTDSDPLKSEQLEGVKELLITTIKEVRSITKNLSTKILEKHGLEEAIRELCKPFSKIGGYTVSIDYKLSANLDRTLLLTIYRIIQEAINNTMKHASADRITVRVLEKEEHVLLQIEDNGNGFDINNKSIFKTNGLSNIKERADLFRGVVEIESKIKEGTKITCKFPK